jgi:hypothetical protein
MCILCVQNADKGKAPDGKKMAPVCRFSFLFCSKNKDKVAVYVLFCPAVDGSFPL